MRLFSKIFLLFFFSIFYISCAKEKNFNGTWTSDENYYIIEVEISKNDKVKMRYIPRYEDVLIKLPGIQEGYIDRNEWQIIINNKDGKSIVKVIFIAKNAMTIKFEDGSICDLIKIK